MVIVPLKNPLTSPTIFSYSEHDRGDLHLRKGRLVLQDPRQLRQRSCQRLQGELPGFSIEPCIK